MMIMTHSYFADLVKPKKYCHVALCVDASRNYGRGILQGVAEYIETHAPWSLFIDPQAPGSYSEDWLKHWQGDGILIHIENPLVAQHLRRSSIPVVEVSAHRLDLKLPQVGNDDVSIGRLAAEHLLERKFRSFAFSGYPDEPWSDLRESGFAQAIGKSGFTHQSFLCAHRPKTLAEGEGVQKQLTDWIAQLPKPVGLMACSDRHAQRILDACRRANIAVPEEIAVIGVNNDEELCRLSNPPLTSVISHPKKIGYESAALLDRIMSGKIKREKITPLLIPPVAIATRRSTDVTAIDDKLVAEAVRFIREHACDGVGIDKLPAKLGVSRAAFYKRFRGGLGRSPHQEVLRLQLNRVKNLLAQTNLSVEKIAGLAGFKHPEYLGVAFRRETGKSPGQYRRELRST